MTEETKHGSLTASTGGRKAGSAPPRRVFKRSIDCAPAQAGDDRTLAAPATPPATNAPNAAGNDRSPLRAL